MLCLRGYMASGGQTPSVLGLPQTLQRTTTLTIAPPLEWLRRVPPNITIWPPSHVSTFFCLSTSKFHEVGRDWTEEKLSWQKAMPMD